MDKHYYLDPPLYIEVYGVSVDWWNGPLILRTTNS